MKKTLIQNSESYIPKSFMYFVENDIGQHYAPVKKTKKIKKGTCQSRLSGVYNLIAFYKLKFK